MRQNLFFIFVYALLLSIAWGTSVQAADPLCDDALFTQMKQRARLNGQMDVARMENFVYKADSILEYTCFNRFVATASANMSYYFTAGFVNDAVIPTANNWISSNYAHTSMGGRANPELGFAANTDPVYTCDVMNVVWNAAKCLNVDDKAPQDSIVGIFDFISSPDIRTLPVACDAPTVPATVFGVTPVGAAAVAVGTTPPAPAACGAPIPTGNVIDFSSTGDGFYENVFPDLASGGKKYNEFYCPNPACHYTPTDVNAGTCDPPIP